MTNVLPQTTGLKTFKTETVSGQKVTIHYDIVDKGSSPNTSCPPIVIRKVYQDGVIDGQYNYGYGEELMWCVRIRREEGL